ncbi:dna repair rad50 protein [Rutstroemia sp. NJR-2017a WRK4]|nr:dna repair rad50 protein [Rutstroemia sp. NJR-2017a WRK4]
MIDVVLTFRLHDRVRSFDHKGFEVIGFNTPLTLIVGFNGSGKTTIIECLKYATTGQQPPNSKNGGAFIHDPKLAGEKEVLAQVKLSFKSTTGAKMVITRSLQLTVTKTTRKAKTLDSQLVVFNNGERTSMSTKVGEIDQLMQQSLGVSEAVLDNVIFCHQDESLWPMSEPLVLKKKFDDIFEATKYTKAIESLKTLRKDHNSKLKDLQAQETVNKAAKDRGRKMEKQMMELQAEIEREREKALALQERIDEAVVLFKEKNRLALEAESSVNELENRKQKVTFIEDNIANVMENWTELTESDEWLQSTLDQYEDRLAEMEQQKSTYTEQYNEHKRMEAKANGDLGKKHSELGRYQAEKQSHERLLEHRVQLVKDAAFKYSIRGYEDDVEESMVGEFVERIKKLSRDKERELARIRTTTNEELQKVQSSLTELQNRHAILVQDKVTAKQTITANERRIGPKQNELGFIQVDEGDKAGLETSLKETQNLLEKLRAQFDAAAWDNRINSESSRIRELEEEERRLQRELFDINKRSKDRASLDYVIEELKKSQAKLDTMMATYGDKLKAILGSDWEVSALQREFQNVQDQKIEAVTEARGKQEVAKKLFTEAGFKLNALRGDLKTKKEQLKSCENAVVNSIITDGSPLSSVEDYPRELEALEDDRDQIRADIDNFKHLANFYNGCLTTIQRQDKCKLCDRRFAGQGERSKAVDKIRMHLAQDARETLEGDLETYNEQVKAAKAVQSQYDRYVALKNDIPDIEHKIKDAEEEKARLLQDVEQQDMIVEEKENDKKQIDSLNHIITSIIRHNQDITEHEAKVDSLASQQKIVGSTMTAEEIESQQTTCSETLRTLRDQVKKISDEKTAAKDRLNQLELELSRKSRDFQDVVHNLAKKQALRKEIEELTESNKSQRESIQRADSELEALKPQIATAKAQYDEVQQGGQAKEKELQAQKEKLGDTVRQFSQYERDLNRYIDDRGPEKLAACELAIENIKQDQKHIKDELDEVTKKINAVSGKIRDSDKLKRNIKDNITYRKQRGELEEHKRAIADLEARSVVGDWERLTQEANDQQALRHTLDRQYTAITTSMDTKNKTLEENLTEWEVEYKDAKPKYRESMIKVKTTKAAIDDLGKMITAMDKAIVKYHSVKMEEINRIAGELWQGTYQGTDVDTIMIRSEKDEGETASGNKKTNYKYRVVMQKDNVEMDMRGRCSAGQKVLASIIIRLALAECFGINCGLIALDEPTTNLDQDNIRALAQSLHGIIKARQAQANFQLIIITHDEEFLKVMHCADFCDDYYQVSRDSKQNSKIDKCSIGQVMEGS